MGVPLDHPFLDGIFPYKPSSYGYPHDYGNSHIIISYYIHVFENLAAISFHPTIAVSMQPGLGMIPQQK